MRCLGFGRGRIALMFVAESVLISGFGAVAGVAIPLLLFRKGATDLGGMAPDFYMTPYTTGVGLGLGLAVGLLAGLAPSVAASRRSIVDGLRKVD
jgi:putative ABC transport system permease protein